MVRDPESRVLHMRPVSRTEIFLEHSPAPSAWPWAAFWLSCFEGKLRSSDRGQDHITHKAQIFTVGPSAEFTDPRPGAFLFKDRPVSQHSGVTRGLTQCGFSGPIQDLENSVCLFFFFFFAVSGLELRAYTLSYTTSPFCVRHFQDRVLQTISLGWLRTAILLISAS
jgi:hypothetical protein